MFLAVECFSAKESSLAVGLGIRRVAILRPVHATGSELSGHPGIQRNEPFACSLDLVWVRINQLFSVGSAFDRLAEGPSSFAPVSGRKCLTNNVDELTTAFTTSFALLESRSVSGRR